jgi:hypothetical protein
MEQTATQNPAAEAARAELKAIMSDPSHRLHTAWRHGDAAAVDRHLQPFYDKVAGASALVIDEEGLTVTGAPSSPPTEATLHPPNAEPPAASSAEDRAAQAEVDTMLRETLGDDYETEMRDMRIGAAHLFSIPDGQKVADAFAPLITELGPQAELLGVRFLAELGRLSTARKGG